MKDRKIYLVVKYGDDTCETDALKQEEKSMGGKWGLIYMTDMTKRRQLSNLSIKPMFVISIIMS